MEPSDAALLKAYELAHDDHRKEVALVWDRTKFFLTINPAILAVAGAVAAFHRFASLLVLGVGLATSLVGALAVWRSHKRTRATRRSLDHAANRVGVQGPEITGGQQELHGKKRTETFRIVWLVVFVLTLNAALDATLALYVSHDESTWPRVATRDLMRR